MKEFVFRVIGSMIGLLILLGLLGLFVECQKEIIVDKQRERVAAEVCLGKVEFRRCRADEISRLWWKEKLEEEEGK